MVESKNTEVPSENRMYEFVTQCMTCIYKSLMHTRDCDAECAFTLKNEDKRRRFISPYHRCTIMQRWLKLCLKVISRPIDTEVCHETKVILFQPQGQSSRSMDYCLALLDRLNKGSSVLGSQMQVKMLHSRTNTSVENSCKI